jgi:hypothetical protein
MVVPSNATENSCDLIVFVMVKILGILPDALGSHGKATNYSDIESLVIFLYLLVLTLQQNL